MRRNPGPCQTLRRRSCCARHRPPRGSVRLQTWPAQSFPSLRDRRLRGRSEEHTSELQSPDHLVCRLLLEKKNTSTQELYARPDAHIGSTATPVFTYSASPAPGGPGSVVHAGFSPASDVYWRWAPAAGAYQRYYGSSPANLANGGIVSVFFFIVPAAPEIYTLSLHDALPI